MFIYILFYCSFELNFDSVEVYCNEEKTRTFLALGVDALCHEYLINIVEKIDNILGDFKLPKFYEVRNIIIITII